MRRWRVSGRGAPGSRQRAGTAGTPRLGQAPAPSDGIHGEHPALDALSSTGAGNSGPREGSGHDPAWSQRNFRARGRGQCPRKQLRWAGQGRSLGTHPAPPQESAQDSPPGGPAPDAAATTARGRGQAGRRRRTGAEAPPGPGQAAERGGRRFQRHLLRKVRRQALDVKEIRWCQQGAAGGAAGAPVKCRTRKRGAREARRTQTPGLAGSREAFGRRGRSSSALPAPPPAGAGL